MDVELTVKALPDVVGVVDEPAAAGEGAGAVEVPDMEGEVAGVVELPAGLLFIPAVGWRGLTAGPELEAKLREPLDCPFAVPLPFLQAPWRDAIATVKTITGRVNRYICFPLKTFPSD